MLKDTGLSISLYVFISSIAWITQRLRGYSNRLIHSKILVNFLALKILKINTDSRHILVHFSNIKINK